MNAQPEIVVEDPKRDERTFHPAAELFPLLEGTDFNELVKDVREHGLREPIVLHPDGRILDGRNRYRACLAVGVDPVFETWNGHGSAVAYVVSLNLHRRHLDASQRALVAKRIANLAHGGDRRSDQAASLPVVTQAEAAEMMNVSERSVRTAREVLDHGVPELVAAVERGEVSVSAAAAVARLDPDEQRQLVERPKEIAAKAKLLSRSRLPSSKSHVLGHITILRNHAQKAATQDAEHPHLMRQALERIDAELEKIQRVIRKSWK